MAEELHRLEDDIARKMLVQAGKAPAATPSPVEPSGLVVEHQRRSNDGSNHGSELKYAKTAAKNLM